MDLYLGDRVGMLKRSTKAAKMVYFVDCPECSWAYNVYGRSGTDNADQHRKNQQVAARSVQREGSKGMLFIFDICLSNAASLKREFSKNFELTKLEFLDEYCDYILNNFTLRQRVPAGMPVRDPWSNVDASISARVEARHHRLCCPQDEIPETDTQVHGNSPLSRKRKRKKGNCVLCVEANKSNPGVKRKTYCKWRCPRCELWMHPDCFFEHPKHALFAQGTDESTAPVIMHSW